MKKSDLKTGMIVTLRRGVEGIIIGSCLFNEDGTTGILNYYTSSSNNISSMANPKSTIAFSKVFARSTK